MHKFTRKQVLEQVSAVQSGELVREDSAVVEKWFEMADQWLAEHDDAEGGFRGFDERTPEQILLDFDQNDLLLDQLSDDELFKLLGNQGVGTGTE